MCLSSSERRRPLAVCTPSLNVSPFLSSLRRKLRPLRIYNSLQDCSSTRGCQTIQMRHHRSPFSGTLQATVFTVQSQRLTALGRLVGPRKYPPLSKQTPNKKGPMGTLACANSKVRSRQRRGNAYMGHRFASLLYFPHAASWK